MRRPVKLGRICRLCRNAPSRHGRGRFAHCSTHKPLLDKTLLVPPHRLHHVAPGKRLWPPCRCTDRPASSSNNRATGSKATRAPQTDRSSTPRPFSAGDRPADRLGHPAQFRPGGRHKKAGAGDARLHRRPLFGCRNLPPDFTRPMVCLPYRVTRQAWRA